MSTVTAVPIPPVKRGYILWLVVGLLLAAVAAVALARQGDSGIRVTPSGLRYKVVAPGEPNPGAPAHPTDADVALVNYTGTLEDGTVFDKSQQPTPLPVAGVVPGFSEALKLMQKGAKYRVWINPELGYGAEPKGTIPPNSTLVFDVELVDFLPEAVIRQMQQQQQSQQQLPGGAGLPGGIPGGPPPGAVPGGRP